MAHLCGTCLQIYSEQADSVKKRFGDIVTLLGDANASVREAAVDCIKELYLHEGPPLKSELTRYNVRPSLLRDVLEQLDALDQENDPGMSGGGVGSKIEVTVAPEPLFTKRSGDGSPSSQGSGSRHNSKVFFFLPVRAE